LPEEEEGMGEERGERRENLTIYYLIIKGFQQCFPIHWEILLKPKGGGYI
jgi:hypothetical protein